MFDYDTKTGGQIQEEFMTIVDAATLLIASTLVVRTGFMKRNFLDSFVIKRKTSNAKTELSFWFDSTKFFLTVSYAAKIFNERNYWASYPFVHTSGIHPVPLDFLGITGASLTRYGTVTITDNKLVVRTNT